MILKVGQSLASTVDPTTIVVVRAPERDVTLTCGGAEMVVGKQGEGDGTLIEPAHLGGTQLGKRYADEDSGVEVLCTKPGRGRIELDGRELPLKTAKPLPASD